MKGYDGKGQPCDRPATHRVCAPDGFSFGVMCPEHAIEVVDEYKAKVNEQWTAAPIGAAQPGSSSPMTLTTGVEERVEVRNMTEMDEKRALAFAKLAPKRISNVLDALRILKNCANRGSYFYTAEQVEKMERALRDQLADTLSAFQRKEAAKSGGAGFSF